VRTIFKWKKKLLETGNLDRGPLNRKPRKLNRERLREYVKEHPDAYLREMAKEFGVGKTCIASALKEMGITIKKKRGVTRKGTRESVRSMRGQYPSMVRKG
jgi:transposase